MFHYWGLFEILDFGEQWTNPLIVQNGITDPSESQQYTGVRDCNSEFIFVGDIVRHSKSKNNYEVLYGQCEELGVIGIYGKSKDGVVMSICADQEDGICSEIMNIGDKFTCTYFHAYKEDSEQHYR